MIPKAKLQPNKVNSINTQYIGLVILDFFLQQHFGKHKQNHKIIKGIIKRIPRAITMIYGIK